MTTDSQDNEFLGMLLSLSALAGLKNAGFLKPRPIQLAAIYLANPTMKTNDRVLGSYPAGAINIFTSCMPHGATSCCHVTRSDYIKVSYTTCSVNADSRDEYNKQCTRDNCVTMDKENYIPISPSENPVELSLAKCRSSLQTRLSPKHMVLIVRYIKKT